MCFIICKMRASGLDLLKSLLCKNLWSYTLAQLLHFSDEETEGHKASRSCPRSRSWSVSQDWKPGVWRTLQSSFYYFIALPLAGLQGLSILLPLRFFEFWWGLRIRKGPAILVALPYVMSSWPCQRKNPIPLKGPFSRRLNNSLLEKVLGFLIAKMRELWGL